MGLPRTVDVQAEMLEDTHDFFQNRVVLGSGGKFDDDTGGYHDASENCDDIFCVGDHKRDNLSHDVTYTQTQPQGQRPKSEKPGAINPRLLLPSNGLVD